MSKETRPAFLLYASNWLSGTSDMTLEEQGIYMKLLCNQWLSGGLPTDIERLCMIVFGPSSASESLANRKRIEFVLQKFRLENVEGRDVLANARLENIRDAERAKFQNRSFANSENAKKPRKRNNQAETLPIDDLANREPFANDSLTKNIRKEDVYINVNEDEIEDENMGVQGGNLPAAQKFDAVAAVKAFQIFYRLKQGKPRPLETAFTQALIEGFKRLQIPYAETAQRINLAAKEFMDYHAGLGTDTPMIPNPETWLNDGSWQVDWKAASETAKSQKVQNSKTQIQNGKPESIATQAARYTKSINPDI